MRVSFDLLEETFTDKFRDIKIGEFFGFQLTSSQKCIGVKTRENEALGITKSISRFLQYVTFLLQKMLWHIML